MIIVIILLSLNKEIRGQDTLQYPLKTTKVEIGISAGALYTLYTDLELNVSLNNRISNTIVLEAKQVLGLIRQLYLFEGNKNRYNIFYGGATIGANFGSKNRFLEIAIGYGYFHNSTNAWGNSTNGLPIGSMAFKKVGTKNTLRFGVGFPLGLFIGLNF